MNQLTNQQAMPGQMTNMMPQQQQQQQVNMQGIQATNMASMNSGMSNMNLGTGMGRPVQMGNQPMQQMGAQIGAQQMAGPQQMGMSMGVGMNMGMMGNQGNLGNQNMGMAPGMQYNYQNMGMRMPMQAQMYQTPMQGTMGQFRS